MRPNQPDGANRRQPFCFREWVGAAGAAGSTAAVAHLERLPASLAGKRVDEPPARPHVGRCFAAQSQALDAGRPSDCRRYRWMALQWFAIGAPTPANPVDGADQQDVVPCAGMSHAGGSSTRSASV